MTVFSRYWLSRTIWIVAVSLVVSILLSLIGLMPWADNIRAAAGSMVIVASPDAGEPSASLAMYILPFVKEIVLIGLPMALAIGLGRLYRRIAS